MDRPCLPTGPHDAEFAPRRLYIMSNPPISDTAGTDQQAVLNAIHVLARDAAERHNTLHARFFAANTQLDGLRSAVDAARAVRDNLANAYTQLRHLNDFERQIGGDDAGTS